jgi:hypothetical protein
MDERTITVIGEVFIVICGVAISQFFTGGTVVDSDPAFRTQTGEPPDRYKPWHIVSYMMALIVLVTLLLRFLVGSSTELVQEYIKQPCVQTGIHLFRHLFRRFVTDVSFLMFFGAFLVGVAQAKSVRAFMGWLALTSAAGVAWSLVALWRDNLGLPYWWLGVNFVQFVITACLSKWCEPVDAAPAKGSMAARWRALSSQVFGLCLFLYLIFKRSFLAKSCFERFQAKKYIEMFTRLPIAADPGAPSYYDGRRIYTSYGSKTAASHTRQQSWPAYVSKRAALASNLNLKLMSSIFNF